MSLWGGSLINSGRRELRIAPQLSLEKASLDLLNTRTQLVIGFILVAILSAINFSSLTANGGYFHDSAWLERLADLSKQPNLFRSAFDQGLAPPIATLTFLFDWLVWQRNIGGYSMTSFAIFLLCALFLALTSLELTGRYGNRLKAVPAVWACLLFSCYPPVMRFIILMPSSREYELNCLFVLFTIFALNRLVLLREKFYLVLCAIGILLLATNGFVSEFRLANQLDANLLASQWQTLVFPLTLPAREPLPVGALVLAYGLLGILLIGRLMWNKAKPKANLACLICLIGLFCLAKPVVYQAISNVNLFYGAVPFSCCLSFLAFPLADDAKLILGRITSIIGLVALSVLVLALCYILKGSL